MSEKETVQTHNVIQILEGGPVVLFFLSHFDSRRHYFADKKASRGEVR